MILCSPSTVTGSIGVASVRPNVTQGLLDRLKITVETFFLGSKTQSLLHELEGDELERHRKHIDDIYDRRHHKRADKSAKLTLSNSVQEAGLRWATYFTRRRGRTCRWQSVFGTPSL